MNAPQHDQRSVDDDPTGMRALLRGLPEPGPMPDDLVTRIQDALAREAESAGSASAVADLDHHRRTRRHGIRPLHWAAAAGLVAVAGGGLFASGGASGMMAAFGGGDAMSSGSAVAESSLSDARTSADQWASADIHSPEPAGSVITPGDVRITMSDASWTGSDLASAASSAFTLMDRGSFLTPTPGATLGAVSTSDGARECATALGIPVTATVLVDLGAHQGTPAALVLATSAHGERTAYLVGRDCRTGEPDLMLGPQRLT